MSREDLVFRRMVGLDDPPPPSKEPLDLRWLKVKEKNRKRRETPCESLRP